MRNCKIVIVSAVKTCKQCLQTASAFGGSVLRPLGYIPQMKISGAAFVLLIDIPSLRSLQGQQTQKMCWSPSICRLPPNYAAYRQPPNLPNSIKPM